MTVSDIFILLIIVGVCISLGQAIIGYRKGGIIASTALGLFGAYLGITLSRLLDLPELFTVQVGPESVPIFWSVMGSGFFVIFINIFLRRV
jgi:uncharacterized membrane protein YeaQ/YmgE (transglycosylase-associated protein family)